MKFLGCNSVVNIVVTCQLLNWNKTTNNIQLLQRSATAARPDVCPVLRIYSAKCWQKLLTVFISWFLKYTFCHLLVQELLSSSLTCFLCRLVMQYWVCSTRSMIRNDVVIKYIYSECGINVFIIVCMVCLSLYLYSDSLFFSNWQSLIGLCIKTYCDVAA